MGIFLGVLVTLLSLAFSPAESKAPIASWYHECLEKACLTANGEKYNPDGITAAHRTLPFNTRVKVTNLQNGKSVVVRISDRGPAKWTGAEIDLSRGAFRLIADLDLGRIPVSVEVL